MSFSADAIAWLDLWPARQYRGIYLACTIELEAKKALASQSTQYWQDVAAIADQLGLSEICGLGADPCWGRLVIYYKSVMSIGPLETL